MNVEIKKCNRKSISIEIFPDCHVLVRAPYQMKNEEIKKFLEEKKSWIEKNIAIMKEHQEQKAKETPVEKLSYEEIQGLADKAMKILPEKVKYYAEKIGVSYGRITIRNQKTKWGSCSGKGNLNFNCLLMLAPEDIQDYVIVHELCHRKEMNHSKNFWSEVEKVMPDYREKKKWLKDHGGEIMRRMLG